MFWVVDRRALVLVILGGAIAIAAAIFVLAPPVPRSVRAAQGGAPGTAAAASAVIWRVATPRPEVAITFDDGPDPQNTPAVLETLRSHGAVATFFVLGLQAQRYPGLLRSEVAEGSEVCNHGFSHAMLSGKSAAFVRTDVAQAAAVLRSLDLARCRLFRFPYFASDATARAVVASLGYRLVAANIDPQDWRGGSGQRIARWVVARTHRGDIILLHDGGGRRTATLTALGPILDGLAARGLRTVTVSQLLASTQ